eukprot:4589229-Pyramimonas_sp.AAC.1
MLWAPPAFAETHRHGLHRPVERIPHRLRIHLARRPRRCSECRPAQRQWGGTSSHRQVVRA